MKMVALVLLLAIMGTSGQVMAADPLTALTDSLPPGVTVDLLIQQAIDWPPSPNGGSWGIGVSLRRDRLEPTESISIRGSDGGGPGADALYVDHGLLTISDDAGFAQSYSDGELFTANQPETRNPPYRYEARNEGSQCATVLRLSTAPCSACGGGPSTNPNAPVGQSRISQSFLCPEPVRLSIHPRGATGPATISFLARVTIEPDADWDMGQRLDEVVILVEKGELSINDATGERLQLSSEEDLALSPNAPHLLRNRGQTPLVFLMFGALSVESGNSVLEVHRARCGPGAQPPYFQDCHNRGEAGVFLQLEGPDDYGLSGVTEIGLSDTVTTPGPAIAIFRGIPEGQYHLSQRQAESSDRVFIACFDRTEIDFGDGDLLAEQEGSASAGIDIDVPPDSFVVCEWYAGIS